MVCLILSLIRVGLMLRLISIWRTFEVPFFRPYMVIIFLHGHLACFHLKK